jgi:hypothetical protein
MAVFQGNVDTSVLLFEIGGFHGFMKTTTVFCYVTTCNVIDN